MARFALLAVCAARGAVALVPPAAPAARSQLRMAGDAELVPVNEDSIKTSSAVTAGGAGFLVGGPVFGAITAAAGNYAAKQDSEVGEVVRGVGKVSLDVYNFLLKINGKYDLTDKAGAQLKDQLNKLKAGSSGETIAKVEDALGKATSKFAELDKEYDLVEKGKQALGYAGDLSDKGIELNAEYKLTDQVVAKVTEAGSAAAAKATK